MMDFDDDHFAIYFHHGGKFETIGGSRFYCGGIYERKLGFEKDKFGYFDVVDEVEKLGYVKWKNIAYKIPKKEAFVILKDDQDVMKMLQNLSERCYCISLYVDGGLKGSEKEIADEVVKNHKGKGIAIEGSKSSACDSTVTKLPKGSDLKHKGKANVVFPQKKDRFIDKGKGKVEGKGKGKERVEGKEKAEGKGKGEEKAEGKGKGKENADGKGKGKGKVEGKDKGSGSSVKEDVMGISSLWKDLQDFNEDSDSDISWYDSDEDDEACETDDSLDDDELGSGDEEYQEARQNINQEHLRIDSLETEIPECEGSARGSARVPVEVEGIGGIQSEGREEMLSDYVDSDEEVNSTSSEDENDLFPKRKREKKRYDPKCDHSNLDVKVGLLFEDGLQCRAALKSWAILNGHPIHFRRVTKNQIEAYCSPPCTWRMYGSLVRSDKNLKIKRVDGTHTCGFDVGNKQADYQWLGKEYMNVFRVRPTMTISEFAVDVKGRFNLKISRGRLHRAKHYSFELLRGTVEQHYGQLRSYIRELMRADREGRFELQCGEGSVFQRLYIGFSALKEGFRKGCRWIIGLDGCHLKTYLRGQLLCATAKDGNNQMYPIAWAVVEVENQDSWTWFITILLEELRVTDGNGLTIISDQQKGLLNAVKLLAPLAEHRNCARHVYCNWKKQYKGATLKNMFWKAVRCTYHQAWNDAVEELKAENQRAFDNFMEREPARWCKAFISTQCVSDMVDNNISETFNGYIVRTRSKHIIHMLEDIRSALRERQYVKLEMIKKVTDKICPNIRKKVEKLVQESRFCSASLGIDGSFEVKHLISKDRFIVSLGNRKCSCRKWDITGIPCIHGISAIHFLRHDVADYVNTFFTVEKYKEAYSFGLPAINGEKLWPKANGYPVLPPLIRKMPGRPRKKRLRDPDERDPKNPNRLRRSGLVMTCQRCLQTGHNARTCQREPVPKPHKELGKRGRPRKNPALVAATTRRGTSQGTSQAPSSQTASAALKKAIAKERAQARNGIGLLVGEATGNTYLHMSSGAGIHTTPGSSSNQSTSTSRPVIPTQESHIQ